MGSSNACHRIAVVLALLALVWTHVSCQRILIKHTPDVAADVALRASSLQLTPVAQTNGLTVMKFAANAQLKPENMKLLLEAARSWAGVEHAEEDQPRYMHVPLTEQQQREDKLGCRNKNVALSDTPVPEYLPYGVSQIQGTSSKLPWRTDDKGMLVCIIDSGLDKGHPDLTNDILDGCKYQDAFAPAGCPFPWGQDYVGHGTHVAGTIAAQRNGFGVVGVIPGPAEVYVVRVFNDTGDVNQGQGLVYGSTVILAFTQCEGRLSALQNAFPEKQYRMVVSMSLGAPGPLTIEQMYFREAIKRGDILFVASSGNNGTGESLTADGEITTEVNPGNYPGSYPEVIAVAAVDCNNKLASFSQKNPSVDLAAPGVQIMSTASREDMPPGIMFGGFMSTSEPKIRIQGNTLGASQLGAAGTGKFTGNVADCGTGAAPCPAAKDNICLIQYDPQMRTIKLPKATEAAPAQPPKADSSSSGNNGVQQVQQSSRWSGMFEAAQRLFSRGGSGAAAQQQQQQRQPQQQQQLPTPRQAPANDEQSIQEPSRYYCESMEFCMKQGAKAMLIGPPAIASGYYGEVGTFGGARSEIVQRIQAMPILASFDCQKRGCSCWDRIKDAGRLPAAGLSLQQYLQIKSAVGEATRAGRQYTGTVESKGGAYKYLSGTSMAVPHVTGAIARVWAAFPNCKSDTVRAAFERTAKDLGAQGRDVQFGHGLVQAEAAFNYLAGQPCAKGPQPEVLSADLKTQQGQ